MTTFQTFHGSAGETLVPEQPGNRSTSPTIHGCPDETLAPQRAQPELSASNSKTVLSLTTPPTKPRWVDVTETEVDLLWLYGPNTNYSELLEQAPLSKLTADVPILAALSSELVTTGALPAILPSCKIA